MGFKRLIFFCLLALTTLGNHLAFASEQKLLTFAMMGYSKVKEQIYREQLRNFEKRHPNIKVRLVLLTARNYPELLKETLALRHEVDVINWFAGDRLNTLVQQNMLEPLNQFWQLHQLDNKFNAASKSAVEIKGNLYGIPITSYIWGFYYKKSLFEKLSLQEPRTWLEFLKVLQTLKENRVAPIALGSRYPWQIAGWFDYLLLRLYGQQYYQAVMAGKIAFTSKEITQVFQYWHKLLEEEFVFPQHKFYDGEELMPLLYREVVGVNLIGTFVLNSVPVKLQQEFGFFPFPQISEQADSSVLAPLSIIALTKYGKSKPYAAKLLAFFASEPIQQDLNDKLSTFSPMRGVEPKGSNLMKEAYLPLVSSSYQSQFFDIEMSFEMAEYGKAIFAEFIRDKDIGKATGKLEAKRKQLYLEQE